MARTAEFLKAHPKCCFCGGQTPATEIDHQPAKIIFPDKHRPKGLEFPACSRCNRQTSGGEALLAFICRFAGSRRENARKDFHRLKDIVSTIEHSFPGLLARMNRPKLWVRERSLYVRSGAIDVNQSEVNLALCRIAAKLSLAIYYSLQERSAATSCQIKTQWTHCQNSDTVQGVKSIIAASPQQAFLRMGQWHTDDTFFIRYYFENGRLFVAAIFHESVALLLSSVSPTSRSRMSPGRSS